MTSLTSDEEVEYQLLMSHEIDDREREACEGSLIEFLRCAWPHIGESGEFAVNWHHEEIASHLEAVGRGEIRALDDPHSTKGVESLLMRQSTIDGMRSLATRITDPRRTARVLVMQRLHQGDGTDYALKNWGDDVTHLCFPMRFEADRACFADHRDHEGELLWPDVFTEESVAQIEKELLEYGCTPRESPILMSDLTMKPISEVNVGDEVVGFTTFHSHSEDHQHGRPPRRKLVRSTVLSKHRYHAPVCRITLKSGAVIRATHDHRWYQHNSGPTKPIYQKAAIGRRLARICPAHLPTLSVEEERLAGWLSGFFDGEGSVSLSKKFGGTAGYRASSTIAFYQGAGRNLPLCDKLERALTHFGLPFVYSEDERKDNKEAACYGYRCYRLRGNSLPLYQRFLHIVQPSKWCDRIVDAAYGAKFVREWDEIESMELDGEEDVFALETTTGNYVVWGYASSNSAGQLQQRPIPRGGGIIKREWLQPWPPWNSDGTFPQDMVRQGRIQLPALEYVVGWVDTAYTEKQQNDPSAMIVLGVFRAEGKGRIEPRGNGTFARVADDYGFPKVLLLYGWQKRLTLHGPPEEIPPGVGREEWASLRYRTLRQESWGLVEWVADTVKRYKIDYLGIETQAAGHPLDQELRRVHADLPCSIETLPAKGDKWARLYSVSGLFSSGQIYVPTYEDGTHPTWAEPLVTELVMFPRAEHDEAVDVFSGALKHLRETAIFERREEFDRGEQRAMSWETNKRVNLPYDILMLVTMMPTICHWLFA